MKTETLAQSKKKKEKKETREKKGMNELTRGKDVVSMGICILL